ncbi:MAG: hypothetical protein JST04_06215 [Bdellovibrionales bacterium]|nr:hypothetical protein [Bdellovibrionales bacterium]
MKSRLFVFLALALASGSASASQFAECRIDSYDACPNALQWSCRRYAIYARDFETEGWFGYKLYVSKNKSSVQSELEKLQREGVCPGKYGNQPRSSIDPKYIEQKEKDDAKFGKKFRRKFLRIF